MQVTFPPSPSLKGAILTVEFLIRFGSCINFNGPIPEHLPHLGNCHLWTGSKNSKGMGYGRTWAGGKTLYTHRTSYVIHFGEIPDDKLVLHKCDNPLCVRKEHLFLGTHEDNMADMKMKNRAAPLRSDILKYGDDHWTRKKPHLLARGDNHGNSKVPSETILKIRAEFAAGGITKSDLGRKYGYVKSHICRLISGESWKHLQ